MAEPTLAEFVATLTPAEKAHALTLIKEMEQLIEDAKSLPDKKARAEALAQVHSTLISKMNEWRSKRSTPDVSAGVAEAVNAINEETGKPEVYLAATALIDENTLVNGFGVITPNIKLFSTVVGSAGLIPERGSWRGGRYLYQNTSGRANFPFHNPTAAGASIMQNEPLGQINPNLAKPENQRLFMYVPTPLVPLAPVRLAATLMDEAPRDRYGREAAFTPYSDRVKSRLLGCSPLPLFDPKSPPAAQEAAQIVDKAEFEALKKIVGLREVSFSDKEAS